MTKREKALIAKARREGAWDLVGNVILGALVLAALWFFGTIWIESVARGICR